MTEKQGERQEALTVNRGNDERAVCESGSFYKENDQMDQRTRACGITNMKERWVRRGSREIPYFTREDP